MKGKIWMATAAIAVAGLAVAGILLTDTAEVSGAVVIRGDLVIEEYAEGSLIETVESPLVCEKGGSIAALTIAEGDEVVVGDAVLTLSDETIRSDIQAVSAELYALELGAGQDEPAASENEELTLAVAAAEHAAELALGVGVEYIQLNEAVERAISAQANAVFASGDTGAAGDDDERIRLEVWLSQLEAELNDLTQHAEVSGRVAKLNVAEGEAVAQGDVIAVLSNPAGGMVSAACTAGVRGDAVKLTTGGKTYTGTVVGVSIDANERVLLIEPQEGFVAGGDITVTLTSQRAADVCLVPVECVASDENGDYAMVLTDGRLEKRPVTTAIENGELVAITSGLGVGERAVMFPERYEDGERAKLSGE